MTMQRGVNTPPQSGEESTREDAADSLDGDLADEERVENATGASEEEDASELKAGSVSVSHHVLQSDNMAKMIFDRKGSRQVLWALDAASDAPRLDFALKGLVVAAAKSPNASRVIRTIIRKYPDHCSFVASELDDAKLQPAQINKSVCAVYVSLLKYAGKKPWTIKLIDGALENVKALAGSKRSPYILNGVLMRGTLEQVKCVVNMLMSEMPRGFDAIDARVLLWALQSRGKAMPELVKMTKEHLAAVVGAFHGRKVAAALRKTPELLSVSAEDMDAMLQEAWSSKFDPRLK